VRQHTKNLLCLTAAMFVFTVSSPSAATIGAMYKNCKPFQTAGFPETFQTDTKTGALSFGCHMYFKSLSDIAFGLCFDKSMADLRGETPPDYIGAYAFEAKVAPLITAFLSFAEQNPDKWDQLVGMHVGFFTERFSCDLKN
jgi:hypothetical protein